MVILRTVILLQSFGRDFEKHLIMSLYVANFIYIIFWSHFITCLPCLLLDVILTCPTFSVENHIVYMFFNKMLLDMLYTM